MITREVWSGMLDDLLNLEEGLSDWEVDRVSEWDQLRLANPSWIPSDRQLAKIMEMYDQRV